MTADGLSQAQQAFAECYYRIQCPSSAQRLWERHFSADDRQRFESDLDTVYRRYRTAGMWANLRGVSLDRAVLDVGRALNFLTQPDYEWLIREIGEYPTAEGGDGCRRSGSDGMPARSALELGRDRR